MKTKLFVLTMAAALGCGSSALFAQDTPPSPPAPGGSGGEGRPQQGPGPQGGPDRLAEFIQRADTDKDGKLSKDEFVASTKKDAEDRFSKIDTNADGFVEKSEAEEMARRARELQQRGGEGQGMRRPEGGTGEGGARPRPGAEGQPPAPGPDGAARPEGGPRPEGFRRPEGGDGPRPEGFRRPEGTGSDSPGMRREGGGGGGFGMADRLRRMDKNGDQNISKEEYQAASEEQFAQMDENKDGQITPQELEALGRRMREMMQGQGRGGEGRGDGARRPGGEGGDRPQGDGARPRPEGEAAPAPRPEGEAAPKKDGV